ncbi:hypothetical protein P389DRAFT_86836 [Cystobasidium minutum MCA 4210]|uniref:uncharacterized protein n=1 Tax=Cystobasidium minutum MCA 4210 TaxID=1397322 RepID=UPI0034CE27FA|eukprot:jgi/Rhomi1/86836/CE86835_38344
MTPMHRLAATLVARSPASAAVSSSISRRTAATGLRAYSTGKGTDTTTASGQPRDPEQVKNHDEAQKGHSQQSPFSEGHSVDRSKSNMRFQDTQSQEATKAREERDGGYSNSGIDTANLSHGNTAGQAEKQRQANSTSSEEGKKGTEEAPSSSTLGGLGQFAKNIIGQGPASGKSFHTYAGPLRAKATTTPSEAVDKGARKPKDTGVGAEQTPHLPHHNPGEGDQLPAVKNNAGLPSKGGKTPSDKGEKGVNSGKGPSHEARPVGTASTPGSRAVDPATSTHSPSWMPETGPKATYTHVTNQPEPDSHKAEYAFSESMPDGAVPSGKAGRSSTSRDAYNENTTSGILKREAGVGSSNKAHWNNQDEAGEMVDEMVGKYPGQEGDDAGGRNQKPPPDAAQEIGLHVEDTLPKPIKA